MKSSEFVMKHKAGTIPYFIDGDDIKMLFMVPSDPNFGGSKFQIAKGHIDDGESPITAAFREAKEELGLSMDNVANFQKLTTQVLTGLDETYILTVYAAEVNDASGFSEPHYETGQTAWLTLDEFHSQGRANQLPVVRLAHDFIHRKRENARSTKQQRKASSLS